MDEYKFLREEIMDKMNKQDKLTQFAYTTAAAIWSLALTVNSEWILLIALFIAVPVSLRIVKIRMDCAFLAAYMSAFLEQKIDITWECNNELYCDKHPRGKAQGVFYLLSKFDFVFIVLITSGLFWFMRIDNLFAYNWIFTILLILFQVTILIIEICIVISFSRFAKYRKNYCNEWKKILCKNGVKNEKV